MMQEDLKLKKRDLNWQGIRCLDVNSRSFYYNNRYYKAIRPTAQDFVLKGSFDNLLEQLHVEGFIPATLPAPIQVEGFAKTYSQHTEFFSLPLWQANLLTIKEAAQLYIRLNRWLYSKNLVLNDGHVHNMLIQGLDAPKWCDIGSILQLTPHTNFTELDEFIKFFIYPLLLRTKCHSMDTMMRFGLKHSISHESAMALQLWNKPFDMPKTRLNLLDSLEQIIEDMTFSFERPYDNEYDGGIYLDANAKHPEINQRIKIITHMFKALAPQSVVDLGAKSLGFANYLTSLGAEVLMQTPSEIIAHQGHTLLRSNPIFTNAKHSPAIKYSIGLWHENYQEADLALALDLVHQLFLERRYPFESIAKILASYSKKHLMTEFVQNPESTKDKRYSPPQHYNIEAFVEELKFYFAKVEVMPYPHSQALSPRALILCTDKITH